MEPNKTFTIPNQAHIHKVIIQYSIHYNNYMPLPLGLSYSLRISVSEEELSVFSVPLIILLVRISPRSSAAARTVCGIWRGLGVSSEMSN